MTLAPHVLMAGLRCPTRRACIRGTNWVFDATPVFVFAEGALRPIAPCLAGDFCLVVVLGACQCCAQFLIIATSCPVSVQASLTSASDKTCVCFECLPLWTSVCGAIGNRPTTRCLISCFGAKRALANPLPSIILQLQRYFRTP